MVVVGSPAVAESVFAAKRALTWPVGYHGQIVVQHLEGGTPRDPNKVEGWLIAKMGDFRAREVADLTLEILTDLAKRYEAQGIEMPPGQLKAEAMAEAAKQAGQNLLLNGFEADENGLFISAHILWACMRECATLQFGNREVTKENRKKRMRSWFPEHVLLVSTNPNKKNKLYLGRDNPDGIAQKFIHTFNTHAIGYNEYVEGVSLDFDVMVDPDAEELLTEEEWAKIWLRAENRGIGANTSQLKGRFVVTRWDRFTV